MSLPPFQRVLDAHGDDLLRFCVAHAGPQHGADCFQEAVLAALRAYPMLRDPATVRGWLFTIAHHKVIDHHRGAARRAVPVDVVPDDPGPAPGATGDPALAAGNGDLWSAVGQLPPKQRGAVALRYLADLAYAEIAVALDCSEAAARQNVRAGLAALRQEVTP